jgi:hypothetical protein
MRLIIFMERLHRTASWTEGERRLRVGQFLGGLGSLLQIEFFDEKYCVGLISIRSRGLSQLSSVVHICEYAHSCRFFVEFKQFKRFVLNMEKRFVTFNSDEDLLTVEQDLLPLLREFRGAIRVTITRRQEAHEHRDPAEQGYQYIIELEQKKTCLTTAKLEKLNQILRGKLILERMKVFSAILAQLKIALLPRNCSEYLTKPTTKIYHYLQKAEQPKKGSASRPNFRFSVSQQASGPCDTGYSFNATFKLWKAAASE